jgi:hypothetical protein
MANCPHCSVDIESLPGFVSQEKLEERLKAKSGEIDILKTSLSTAQAKAQGFAGLTLELSQLKEANTARDQAQVRGTAMTEAGLDPSLLPHVEALYSSATSGMAEKPTLSDWLAKDGKEHPILSPHFGAPPAAGTPPALGTPPAGTPPVGTPPAPNLNPQTILGAKPPAPPATGVPSAADVQKYFQSPEFKAMPRDAQKAKFAEVQAQVNGQGSL